MYSAVEIARFVIDYCTRNGMPISNLHLQKILYFLQVHFAKKNVRLYREDTYAWQYGPVEPNVYYLFSGYGGSKISNRYPSSIDNRIETEIKPIIRKLAVMSAWNLVSLTHVEGGPWDRTYNHKEGADNIIEFDELKKDFVRFDV